MESRQPPPSASGPADAETITSYHIPSESELVLLSLDYLRDLRRAYANKEDLLQAEGLDADWLTVAIFALNRAFASDSLLSENDGWKTEASPVDCHPQQLPSLEEMTDEVVYSENPTVNPADPSGESNDPKDEDLEAFAWYEYDDAHLSNQHRLYSLNGLAGGNRGPLLLGEIAAAGLHQLQARTRHSAEEKMITSPLFEQFVQAVQSKGFFKDPANETPFMDSTEEQERLQQKEAVYQQRYDKVVTKFRTKLALQADPSDDSVSDHTMNLADLQYTRRLRHCLSARKERHVGEMPSTFNTAARLAPGKDDPQDVQEAERLKNIGNAHMQQKDYPAAAAAYTQALKLSPSGTNSHVYFSNRAAALLSMKQFPEAISDSERSLALKPNYGKAHARLGLAHFLLSDYQNAMEAYTVALKYEPNNKSSRSYLEKAVKRLAKQEEQSVVPGSSFSVVSEWEKANPDPAHVRRTTNPLAPFSQTPEHREAEKAKVQGNQSMARRQYQEAFEAYTKAIDINPSGPQSHVYYSNRAAALCYLERYDDASNDSLQSLQLKPTYGKAHARLGLSRFFLQDYPGAIQAYTAALKYDPDNAASKSYLAKAKLRWEQQGQQTGQRLHVDNDARRLINDPDMQTVAKKVLTSTPKSGRGELMEDPEVVRIARKAMRDPTMMAAVKAAVHH